ncbi:hypothetical protein ACFW4O_08075 [Streptomyces mutabilis]|uniref:hypothetical protein n=1 Tax=Streptomyces TaxID=1883 RepID=UPI000BD5BF04|nr:MULTISPECIES: hypothetical protein [unclassified Streptomyces]MDN3247460.1 hypothetical protein [Streptomyces sp. ZSW22]MDN3251680.1 hypothetical protein [Streptomyces sp. MA25(2023)]MDQ0388029.1 hypothetical protein [Streptomyces sp. DSM 42143]PAK27522.1 hypothetical protein CJD44_03690 [Streptomyces sp. alain-838]
MATTYDFPSDLLAGQEELHQVRAELSALLKRLPWSVEPLDGFSDDNGWRKVERPASPGWSADEQAEVEKLRQRERELAVFVSTHRYWSQITGPDRVTARSELKRAHAAPDRETPPGDA